MRKTSFGFALIAAVTIGWSSTAGACGFLVARNGAVQLQRTTTLAAFHNGVEHYVTSFAFASDQPEFGSIIPLPGRPTLVERAGDWTLQRLEREVTPALENADVAFAASAKRSSATVVSVTRIDSLTLTVVKGGGREVTEWARENGFTLPADTPQALEFYARRSPYFALAKFDARKAAQSGFRNGDGIPVHIAMPLKNPWVPLRILAAAKPATETVRADVFLLTDQRPTMLTGAGLVLARSQQASADLLGDLRSDKHSNWVPTQAWLTFLKVDVPAGDLDYDLAIDASGQRKPSLNDTGIVTVADRPIALRVVTAPADEGRQWTIAVVAAIGLALVVSLIGIGTWAISRRPT